jgi:hypothetical protein
VKLFENHLVKEANISMIRLICHFKPKQFVKFKIE